FFLRRYGDHRALHSFPTRRSSDLSAGACAHAGKEKVRGAGRRGSAFYFLWRLLAAPLAVRCPLAPPIMIFPFPWGGVEPPVGVGDRKSTRLNSSHVKISYAVFCLK